MILYNSFGKETRPPALLYSFNQRRCGIPCGVFVPGHKSIGITLYYG